nr:serine racemase VanT catalytic subunit [Paenibacillus sp. GSMTC-2017]
MLYAEGTILKMIHFPRHDSMYIVLIAAVYCLFRLALLQNWHGGPVVRGISTWIYLLHPIAFVIVRGGAKATGLREIFIENSLIHFIAVTLLSVLMAMTVVIGLKMLKKTKKPAPAMHRAWTEIKLDHIEHNLNQLKSVIPESTEVMVVVKADGYGHGSVQVSKRLNQAGVRSFAVAEIDEAIVLRKGGIKGDIVILGYTPLNRLSDLRRYNLTQTVIHAEDGERLQSFGKKIKVHIKINTGMNRLGESYSNMERIRSMYEHKNLHVRGTFSHLASASGNQKEDKETTNLQIERFDETINMLRVKGIDPGIVHIQSSYGILNYPELCYGIVRPGIALYGVFSNENDLVAANVDLRPVLSLKARVTMVKSVRADEPVGYDGSYIPIQDSKIATISIGYADGFPRELSQNGGCVLIHGKRVRIVGKICMDQMMVDVTEIANVRQGDVATLIGQDGEETITVGEIAKRVGTITNEVVSALGSRLGRVYQ